jgi:hypothetical protein
MTVLLYKEDSGAAAGEASRFLLFDVILVVVQFKAEASQTRAILRARGSPRSFGSQKALPQDDKQTAPLRDFCSGAWRKHAGIMRTRHGAL